MPIKTLLFHLHAVHFLRTYEYASKSAVYYDWMIRDFLKDLLQYPGGSCPLPAGNEKINYGADWRSKAESAYARACQACEFEAAKYEYSAADEWKKIFGSDYYRLSMDKINLEAIREAFGRVVYAHKTHEKDAERLTKLTDCLKRMNALLAALTTGGVITALVTDQRATSVISAILAGMTALVSIYGLRPPSRFVWRIEKHTSF